MSKHEVVEVGGIAGDRLKAFIDRIERLEEEKKGISEDIKAVYGEAKSTGFDTKVMKRIVKLRKEDSETIQEQTALTELYMQALGMSPDGAPAAM